MTTITIDISERQAAALKAKAQAQGLTLEDWFRRVAEREVPSTSVAQLQKLDHEAWIRQLEASVAGLPKMPVLSEEAMSRQSIYADRT